ncbi:hypothetical protein HPB51_006161 [Rhipicephalus microplus]|uniref:Methyltransferase domain-containing protein n=1 Tax=Rhipicephalus microplus TaxID=6941 RepID=A0A9J6E5T0_RHIMP|nr:hypothetical protein HPB51_006161 [Rhipicephalus microplus]
MPTNSKEAQSVDSTHKSSCYFDPSILKTAKKPGYFHKLEALEYVHFKRPASDEHQYLDIGCGSGGFTKDALLEKVHPCRRIVAVDREEILLEYARKHASHSNISYELFDIEKDDPRALIDKYGQFDRIYSFLALQCVRDLKNAYRNMFSLLKQGGEGALVTLTGSVITDVMNELHCTREWKDYVPHQENNEEHVQREKKTRFSSDQFASVLVKLNPASSPERLPRIGTPVHDSSRRLLGLSPEFGPLPESVTVPESMTAPASTGLNMSSPSTTQDPTEFYSERFFFDAPIVAEMVEEAEREASAVAGLNLVSCSVYDSQWIMPNVDAWIDLYVPVFKLDAKIPEEKRGAFRKYCRDLLEKKTTSRTEGVTMRHSFVVVHLEKLSENPPKANPIST